jgi:hypothetical protein
MRYCRATRWLVVGAFLGLLGIGGWGTAQAQPDPRYYSNVEVQARLNTWASTYPDIFHREIIGYTLVDHEPIWACRISDNADVREPEARILIHAAQHANEANGVGAIMFMMDRLLTRYGHDTYCTNMVNNLELWFVPIVNIDGYKIVFAGGANWDLWRKTKRDNDGNGLFTYPMDGVDPNRNWDFLWAQYPETDPASLRYKGPFPFSEPEIVAIRDLTLRERPVFVMDLHSPDVPSAGNKNWWVWYDPDTGQNGVDYSIYQPISTALGNRCETENDGVYVNGSVASYNDLPKEQCWVYKNTGACIFVMEISLQYWWTGAVVDTIAARTGRGLFYLPERALSGPGLKGTVTSATTGLPVVAEVKVNQVHDAAIGPRLNERFFGQYWRLLLPGTYSVTVSPRGYVAQTQSIYVSATGWTTLNFLMQPDASSVVPDAPASTRLLWADTPLGRGSSVHFRLDEPSRVSLRLLDVSGRQAASLLDGDYGAGVRSVPLDDDLPAGTYLLLLRTDREQTAQKVVVVE